jgi:hypothetical protein
MPERASINQKTQIGVESVSGTAVAASKSLECFSFEMGIEAEVDFFRATGRKYPSVQEESQEWTSFTMDGNADYNGLIYPLSGVAGAATVAAYNSSATAKGWTYTPPISGNASPKTFTFEQGDSVRAHKYAYGLFNKFGYKFDRKSFTVSGEGIGQELDDGISMTSNPTAVALAPAIGKHINVYLDAASADLGTTQLMRVISGEFSMDGVYGPAWFLNRSDASWSTHIDMEPKSTFKLLVEANSSGMAFLDTYLRSGATAYIRVEAQGAQIASDGGGGSDPVYNLFQHDMAVKFDKPDKFSDADGVFAIQWNMQIVEDLSWGSGQAQVFVLVNLLSAL